MKITKTIIESNKEKSDMIFITLSNGDEVYVYDNKKGYCAVDVTRTTKQKDPKSNMSTNETREKDSKGKIRHTKEIEIGQGVCNYENRTTLSITNTMNDERRN
jgi:hypothetical protein